MRRLKLSALVVLFLLVGVVSLAQAANVAITVKDATTQTPLQGVRVEIFLSYGILSGVTDVEGKVSFQDVRGRGFWLELNGARRAEFYRVVDSPFVVLMSQAGGAR